ncbi:MAG TPA: tetratricopeptide repeat protein [Granulicella sp.]|nr:tetratricopeptide repeat protein [Granulicella sp.]
MNSLTKNLTNDSPKTPASPKPMTRSLRFASAFLGLALCATPAFAVNKDMVQLQTQVQQLQDAIARLQQSNDERMGVMRDLVQQTADSVNKMSVAVQTLQQHMQTQQDAQNGKIDQVSGQIQSLNDSVDELKARLTRMEKSLQDIQGQQQSISATLQNNNPAQGTPAAPGAPGTAIPQTATPLPSQDNSAPIPAPDQAPPAASLRKPSAGIPLAAAIPTTAPNAAGAPPADDLYKTALGDYMGARYSLATSEFGDVVKFYPDNPLSGNSLYYLGEIDYRAGHFGASVKSYDRVLSEYPASARIPAAHLHKGEALLAMHQNDAGVRELRGLIQRFPNSPEAMQARSRLSGMGVPVNPRR